MKTIEAFYYYYYYYETNENNRGFSSPSWVLCGGSLLVCDWCPTMPSQYFVELFRNSAPKFRFHGLKNNPIDPQKN